MTGIAIYVEGGDSAHQKRKLRLAFNGLLNREKLAAQVKRLGWDVIFSGGRQNTHDAFINAVHTKPDTINVLLVDSEAGITSVTGDANHDARAHVAHLTKRDGWELSGIQPERVHLMVQCMEAWIVADAVALAQYYGQRFAPRSLPQRENLEEEPKEILLDSLKNATRSTQKGEYAKIKHAEDLLQLIDRDKVARRCRRFAVLIGWLKEVIDTA